MLVDDNRPRQRERLLAYAGGAVFVLLGLAAALLWLREGEVVYVERIMSQIANCL